MNKIKVSDLKPGMKFTRAVYITPSNMLVGPNMPLKKDDIEKLKRWSIKEVETAGEIIEDKSVDYNFEDDEKNKQLKEKTVEEYKKLHRIKNKFMDEYKESIRDIKNVLDIVNKDKYTGDIKLGNIANNLVSVVVPNEHIYIYLASNMTDEDDYLPYHSLNVAIFSVIIGHQLNIEGNNLLNLAKGALLHDIGMLKIPSDILKKKEKLNDKEYNVIKLHTIYGYKILTKDLNFKAEIANIALQHHEQFDGNGYPRKLKGDQIDLFSRIVAIADTYDAMTKKRSYRDEFISYEAMKNILSESQNKFDPRLLRIFLSNMSIYPLASLVKLNTGAIGMVIGTCAGKPLRPIIKIIIDEFGDKTYQAEERIIYLSEDPDIFITGAVDDKELGLNTFDLI